MKSTEQAARRRQLLNDTRDLLLNIQGQYNIPIPMARQTRPRTVQEIPVHTIMRTEVETISPDADLKEASTTLLAKEISHLPVTKANKLVGIVSKTDILRGIAEGHGKVSEIMTKQVQTVNPTDSIQEIMRKAEELKVSGFPVTDKDGKLVGIITEKDIRKRLEPIQKY